MMTLTCSAAGLIQSHATFALSPPSRYDSQVETRRKLQQSPISDASNYNYGIFDNVRPNCIALLSEMAITRQSTVERLV